MKTIGKGTIMEGIGINRITQNFKASQVSFLIIIFLKSLLLFLFLTIYC